MLFVNNNDRANAAALVGGGDQPLIEPINILYQNV